MSVLGYLLEGLQPLTESLGTVYHATDMESAQSIASSGCLHMSMAGKFSQEDSELSRGSKYYLSTMRSSGAFLTYMGKVAEDNNITLELDYDTLRQQMKSIPVNYNPDDMEMGDNWHKDMESEERFISDTISKLCDLKSFVRVAHIYLDDYYDLDEYIDLGEDFISKGVPVLYYDKEQQYISRRQGFGIDKLKERYSESEDLD